VAITWSCWVFALIYSLISLLALSALERCCRHVITSVAKPLYSTSAWRLRQLKRLIEHTHTHTKKTIFIPRASGTVEGLHSYLNELPTADSQSARATRKSFNMHSMNYHTCMFLSTPSR
jgi:hypothetical protein